MGTGFFADAYDLFVIDIVVLMLKDLDSLEGASFGLDSSRTALITLATSLGAVIGMLLFGLLGDALGRRRASLITAAMVCSGSLLSGLVFHSDTFSIAWQLILIRFVLGVGIGGEYPLSATLAREHCPVEEDRARVTAAVFSMQGVGMLGSMVLTLLLLQVASVETTWRGLLMFGVVPSGAALVIRLRMTESAEFIGGRENEAPGMTMAQKFGTTVASLWEYRGTLLVTSSAWFLLDVTFYGTGQFKHDVFDALHKDHWADSAEHARAAAVFGLYVSLMGIPGYWLAAYLIDAHISKRNLQLVGFAMLTGVYIVLAGVGVSEDYGVLGLLVFGLSFFVSNVGPNTTTFVMPSQLFPENIRSTANGVSAASGKLGAVVGSAIFANLPLSTTLWICVGVACAGTAVSFFVPNSSVRRAADELAPISPAGADGTTGYTLLTE
jgi:PHS family inorganic phosphate transporter-like MFS transporter